VITLTDEEAKELHQAFTAAGIFFTPLMRRRLIDSWDDYHADAQDRRTRALEILESKGVSS
jgi:hypothetical protein